MAPTDQMIGALFDGRYKIDRRIGVGGMANVYLAHDETLGRDVAIKVLNQRYAQDEQFVARFLREASAAARLNHPNIVQVYDRGEADDTYYIAMEYVEGRTLKEIIRRSAPLSDEDTYDYARQALSALRFAHRNGVVHRDVKPQNMLVDAEGRLKIADFGIARAGSDAGLTEVGSIVGTAQYLSPEQAQDHGVTAPSDLYSLGVVMYEMATGGVPFDGETPVNVALQHVKDPVPAPSTRAQVSAPLEAVVLRAMQKNPAKRYQSADEFLADIDRAAHGHVSEETSAITRVIDRGVRFPTEPPSDATQVIGTRGGLRPPTPPPARTRPVDAGKGYATGSSYAGGYEDERQKHSRRKRWPWVVLGLVVIAAIIAIVWALHASSNSSGTVPDVTGMSLTQAKAALTSQGYKVGSVTQTFDDSRPAGIVTDEDPSAGSKLGSGGKVDLTVSKGTQQVKVPNFVGMTAAQARTQAIQLGLKLSQTKQQSTDPTVASGQVLSQDTPANTLVDPKTTIGITVASAPAQVSVPGVVNQSVDDATSTLKDAGFTVKTQTVDGATPQGEVASQSPAANAQVAKGSTVTLKVGSGSNAVPDVTGEDQDSAAQDLEQAGFNVTPAEAPQGAQGQGGTVVSTSPAAGKSTKLGTTVTIYVVASDPDGTSTTSTTGGAGMSHAPGPIGAGRTPFDTRLAHVR